MKASNTGLNFTGVKTDIFIWFLRRYIEDAT